MQVLAIVVSLVITLVALALFARAIGQIVSVVRLGPAGGRAQRPAGRRWRDDADRDPRSYPDAAVVACRHRALVRLRRFRLLVLHAGDGVRAAVRRRVRAAADRSLGVFEWATDLITWLMIISILALILIRVTHLPSGHLGRYSRFSGSRMWQAYFVEAVILGIGLCILTLRGAEYALAGADADRADYPLTWFIGEGLDGWSHASLENLVYMRGDAQDRHLVHLDDRAVAEHHDGGGLAPLHGVAQHLVQARVVGPHGAGWAAADHGQGCADRLREHRRSRRGHRVRCRQGRGLHLEGDARLHVVYRVRALPVAVPGLEHREAAVSQDVGDGLARARLRQGACLLAGDGTRPAEQRRPRPSANWSARPRAMRGGPRAVR